MKKGPDALGTAENESGSANMKKVWHFLYENLPLIVGQVLSKFGYFWSKITPESTQKPNRAQNRRVQKTAQNSLCPGPYGARMCPENTPWDQLLTRFDLSIKIFDRYT
jgi:hypothetical protein